MSYFSTENIISVRNIKYYYSKTLGQYNHPTAESNALSMEIIGPKIFSTNVWLQLVSNETKFTWKQLKEILYNVS